MLLWLHRHWWVIHFIFPTVLCAVAASVPWLMRTKEQEQRGEWPLAGIAALVAAGAMLTHFAKSLQERADKAAEKAEKAAEREAARRTEEEVNREVVTADPLFGGFGQQWPRFGVEVTNRGQVKVAIKHVQFFAVVNGQKIIHRMICRINPPTAGPTHSERTELEPKGMAQFFILSEPAVGYREMLGMRPEDIYVEVVSSLSEVARLSGEVVQEQIRKALAKMDRR